MRILSVLCAQTRRKNSLRISKNHIRPAIPLANALITLVAQVVSPNSLKLSDLDRKSRPSSNEGRGYIGQRVAGPLFPKYCQRQQRQPPVPDALLAASFVREIGITRRGRGTLVHAEHTRSNDDIVPRWIQPRGNRTATRRSVKRNNV